MILRSLSHCSSKRQVVTSRPSTLRNSFYARLYGVVNAMQLSEDPACEEGDEPSYRSRRPVKLDIEGIPGSNKLTAKPPSKSEYKAELETGLGTLASSLDAIDRTLKNYKTNLRHVYDAKSKRRRALLDSGLASLKDDPTYLAHERDAHKLELAIRNAHLNPDSGSQAALYKPDIVSSRASSRVLDNSVHDLLREVKDGQVHDLAKLISSTRVAPTVKTFNIMISRLTKLRLNAAAWIVYVTMLRLDFRPDGFTVSSALNLCIVSGSYLDFRKVLYAERVRKKLLRNSTTDTQKGRSLVLLSTIIKGCVKFGRMRRAETYMKLMRNENVQPNMEILTILIRGYAECADWNSGLPHFEKLFHKRWDRKTVATMIAYCRACKKPLYEQHVRNLAAHKGVVTAGPDDDLALLPMRWKTKGLDVPDRLKDPRPGDVGAIQVRRPSTKKPKDDGDSEKWKKRAPVFVGTRSEALGDWAYHKRS